MNQEEYRRTVTSGGDLEVVIKLGVMHQKSSDLEIRFPGIGHI